MFRFLSFSIRSLLSLVCSLFGSLLFFPFSLFSSFSLVPVPPHFFFFFPLSLFFGLFIEPKGGAFYGCTWGARAAAVGRPFGCSCRGSAPCFSGRRAAGGRPVSAVGGPTAWGFRLVRRVVQRERGNAFVKKETTKGNHFSFLPCCMSRGGRKRNSVVQNDTVPFSFFFLFFTWNGVVLSKTRRFI